MCDLLATHHRENAPKDEVRAPSGAVVRRSAFVDLAQVQFRPFLQFFFSSQPITKATESLSWVPWLLGTANPRPNWVAPSSAYASKGSLKHGGHRHQPDSKKWIQGPQ